MPLVDNQTQLGSPMPDISHETQAQIQGKLEKVGMENIEMPIQFQSRSGTLLSLPSKISAFVNLQDAKAKGIHMSRLYLTLKQVLGRETLNYESLSEILKTFVETHESLSTASYVHISFELPVERAALVSKEMGWRHYKVDLFGSCTNNKVKIGMGAEVMYSSTCPCSAALSRQLTQKQFLSEFQNVGSVPVEQVAQWLTKEPSIAATPHSQRSHVNFKVWLSKQSDLDLLSLIDSVEGCLKTPVQAAVKREDEQEFAKLNAQNLMFCEDAGRRVKKLFETNEDIIDYWAHLSHKESLHPHDATSYIFKYPDRNYFNYGHYFK